MGITINEYPYLDGAITLNNVYVNLRDLKQTKEDSIIDDNIPVSYEINFTIKYFINNKQLHIELLSKTYTDPVVDNLWDKCYTILKEHLDSKSLTYIDDM